MKPTWIEGAWNIHHCRIGVFAVTVEPDGSRWKMSVGGVVAKTRWNGLDEAKENAIKIAMRWIRDAAKACEEI